MIKTRLKSEQKSKVHIYVETEAIAAAPSVPSRTRRQSIAFISESFCTFWQKRNTGRHSKVGSLKQH